MRIREGASRCFMQCLAEELRSGWGDAGIGVAARKQAETYLRVQRSGWEGACVGFAEQEVYLMCRRCEGLKMCALGTAQINSNHSNSLKSSRSRERLAKSFQVCMGHSWNILASPRCAHIVSYCPVQNPGSTYIIFWSILVSFCPFKRTNKDTGFFLGGRGVPFPAGFYGAIPGIRTGRMRGLRGQIMCV